MGQVKTLTRDQAAMNFGEDFVRIMMRGKREIELTPTQLILVEKWKMIREMKFQPFAYEYVYVVDNGRGNFKIGLTRKPRVRLSSLNTGSVDDLTLYGLFVVGNQEGRNVERGIQAELKRRDIHAKNEWFHGRAAQWWPAIADFTKARYGRHLVTLADAWEGCEPLVPLYVACHKGTERAIDVVDCRKEFLWVVDRAAEGLTVAA